MRFFVKKRKGSSQGTAKFVHEAKTSLLKISAPVKFFAKYGTAEAVDINELPAQDLQVDIDALRTAFETRLKKTTLNNSFFKDAFVVFSIPAKLLKEGVSVEASSNNEQNIVMTAEFSGSFDKSYMAVINSMAVVEMEEIMSDLTETLKQTTFKGDSAEGLYFRGDDVRIFPVIMAVDAEITIS